MAAPGSMDMIVVWEWFMQGVWRPYDPLITNFIEKYRAINSRINLGAVDQKLVMYDIDFVTQTQVRHGTGTSRPIRRQLYPRDNPAGKGIVWQWEADQPGNWQMFDMITLCLIESSWLQGLQSVDLSKSPNICMPYFLDLASMKQIRIETGNARKIRRTTLTYFYPLAVASPMMPALNMHSPMSQTSPLAQQQVPPSLLQQQQQQQQQQQFQQQQQQQQHPHHHHQQQQHQHHHQHHPQQQQQQQQPQQQQHQQAHFIPSITSNSNIIVNPNLNTAGMIGAGSRLGNQTPLYAHPSQMQLSQHPQSAHHSGQMIGQQQQPSMSLQPVHCQPRQAYLPPYSGYSNGLDPLANGVQSTRALFHMPGAHQPSLSNASVPLNQPTNMKTIGRLISPVVSNITNILVSPAIPVRLPPGQIHHGAVSGRAQTHGRISLTKSSTKLGRGAGEVLKNYVNKVDQPPAEEDCCICYEKIDQPSGYGDGIDKECVKLKKCGHFFHRLCLYAMYNNGHKDDSIQCPTCKTIYGKKLGNCPDGEMDYITIPESLPGYQNTGTIRILYDIKAGIQGPEHPNPGKRFTTKGFPRCCYLPENEKGRKVLSLLIKAWKRRLIFTIGTSTTTGEANTVTWNEIHHKTELYTNYTGHGYPDPNYLDNVLLELAAQGVIDDGSSDESDSEIKSSSLDSGVEMAVSS
ncbi:E3 ubiquitin-protein ligase DTX4 [Octopus sinensis]|uniref:E3 ubiquitin-protein ligase n=1 Tax=Octopus sinensis TaxID=2607531 RepID=A0A7E6FP40_9MOLL|nr:E3 ubiquitin-protein ligase DTX4 [Octopus sinensis]